MAKSLASARCHYNPHRYLSLIHIFKDSDQIYKGIDVDIINEVAKRKNWDVNQTFPGFDAAVNAVQSGQADSLMAGTDVYKRQLLIQIILVLGRIRRRS